MKRQLQIVCTLLLTILIVSCSGSSTGPDSDSNVGKLKVTIKTKGANLQADHYLINFVLGAHKNVKIDINTTITIENIESGHQVIKLSGFDPTCAVDGKNPRSLEIKKNRITSTLFTVDCSEINPNVCQIASSEIINAFSNPDQEIVKSLVYLINHYGARFGFTNKYVIWHFLSQVGEESGGLSVVEENLNYTAQRLLEVFPNYFSRSNPRKKDPDDYAHKPKKIANLVYANKIGNGNVASGDGWKYRGRGIIQLTGRANYRSFTKFYDDFFSSTLDFVKNPDQVADDLNVAVMTGIWYFKARVLSQITIDKNTTVREVTLLVNGGLNGLSIRKNLFIRVKNRIPKCLND